MGNGKCCGQNGPVCFPFPVACFTGTMPFCMRKIMGGILTGVLVLGCAAPVSISLSKDHPAYGFYQTANTFNVSGRECSKLKGSLEIKPEKIGAGQEYEKIREWAPGLFLVKQTATGKQFVTVLFMEYGLVTSLPRTCSWNLDDYPIHENIEKSSG